jgi:hypothetical protein
MKRLVVGQEVFIFGVGRLLGTVVSVSPTVDVQTKDGYVALFRFDNNGKETEASRCTRLGLTPSPEDPFPFRYGPGPEWAPWEIDEASDEEVAARGKLPPNVRKE